TRIFMGLSDASRRRQHSYAGDFASLTAEVKPPIYRWAEGQAITAEPGTLVAPESLSSMTLVRTHSIQANDLQFEVDEAGEGEDVALLLHGFQKAAVAGGISYRCSSSKAGAPSHPTCADTAAAAGRRSAGPITSIISLPTPPLCSIRSTPGGAC